MKIVINKERKVVATHSDEQVITLSLYPQASAILKTSENIISNKTKEEVEVDAEGVETVVRVLDYQYISDDVDISLYDTVKEATTGYIFPLPLVTALIKSADIAFDQELSDLLDVHSNRGGSVVTDPTLGVVRTTLFNSIASLLDTELQEKIKAYVG